MKVFAHTLSAAGHFNPMTGLCQALQERGHKIYFAIDKSFGGKLAKFGFEEVLLEPLPDPEANSSEAPMTGDPIKFFADQLQASGILSNKTALEKTKHVWIENDEIEKMLGGVYDTCVATEPQIRSAIDQIKPDVILLDHFFAVPSIFYSKIPWVFQFSMNPLMIFNSPDLPPYWSGLPANDRTSWSEFDECNEKMTQLPLKYQNRLLEHFGYPPTQHRWIGSPHLNIYGYPAELDYTDVATIPDNFVQIDAFSREIPEPFEFPQEFRSKINFGDKLIYISMGSMGSIDVDLMKRIVGALEDTPHKAVVSKGPLGDEYELPKNMWGENYLPQTNILPLVDLVITHGGNNTTTESFICGKPMIVIPLYSDQYDNAQRVTEKGYGARLDYGFEASQMVATVNRLLNDQAMHQRLQKAALRIKQTNCNKEKAVVAIKKLVNVNKFHQ